MVTVAGPEITKTVATVTTVSMTMATKLVNVDRWNYCREKNRTIKLDPSGDVWYAIAKEGSEEVVRANGATPISAMKALDRVLGEL